MSLGPSPAKAAFNAFTPSSAKSVAAPMFPFREQVPASVARLSLVPDDDQAPSVPQNLEAPRQLLVGKPSRGRGERAVLPGCFGEFPLLKVDNGRLPRTMLCTLWDGKHQLRADAAVSLAKLNVAFAQHFGKPLCVSDGYRTIGEQYSVRALRGWFAASPGTSNHGWGRAADLCGRVESARSPEHQWMVENAPRYGWENPDWARPGGSGPREPWHWEFSAAGEGSEHPGE
jgi:D-alanyl-D-alanine carboxypeptidase